MLNEAIGLNENEVGHECGYDSPLKNREGSSHAPADSQRRSGRMGCSASDDVHRTATPDLPTRLCASQLEPEDSHAPLFPEPVLDSSRLVVLAGQRVNNPPFYGELIKMGFEATALADFAHMSAITFVDTVVSHEPFTDRLLFHELVHVVQYEKLGVAEFAAKYVRGFLSGGSYVGIPLERNAYELEARFASAPAKSFSVEAEVLAWIDAGKF